MYDSNWMVISYLVTRHPLTHLSSSTRMRKTNLNGSFFALDWKTAVFTTWYLFNYYEITDVSIRRRKLTAEFDKSNIPINLSLKHETTFLVNVNCQFRCSLSYKYFITVKCIFCYIYYKILPRQG